MLRDRGRVRFTNLGDPVGPEANRPRPKGLGLRSLLRSPLVAVWFLSIASPAWSVMPGDFNRDCDVNLADAIALGSALASGSTLTGDQADAADVAPLASPDSVVNAGDLLVLLRGVLGLATLPGGSWEPSISVTSSAGANPIAVSGTDACPGADVSLYVNGLLRETTSTADGSFAFPLVGIDDRTNSPEGTNEIVARATVGAFTSGDSNLVTADYVNQITRANPPQPSGGTPVVWAPGDSTAPIETGAYKISSDFEIPDGETLILIPGTEVEIADGKAITVTGELIVQGVGPNDWAKFFAKTTSWKGIRFYPNSACDAKRLDLRGASIEDADTGIDIRILYGGVQPGCSASISASKIHVEGSGDTGISSLNSSPNLTVHVDASEIHGDVPPPFPYQGTGVYVNGSLEGTFLVENNEIRGLLHGIHIYEARPEIQSNWVRQSSWGILIEGANNKPLITDWNIIESNGTGIYLKPKPFGAGWQWGYFDPRINGNLIQNNTTNIEAYAGEDAQGWVNVIDATGNDWGTTSASSIVASITDAADGAFERHRPLVDFTPFLGANQQLVQAYVQGGVDAASFDFDETSAPAVVGPIIVSRCWPCRIPAGVTLHMPPQWPFHVYKELQVEGTMASPVKILSDDLATPMPGDWEGIEFFSGSTGSVVNWAEIRHAKRAINAVGASFTLSNSTIELFEEAGVVLEGATSSTVISGNTIDNYPDDTMHALDDAKSGTGIWLVDSSPAIAGNDIQDAEVGIHIWGDSSPVVDSGNTIRENLWGLWIQGPGADETTPNPDPIITGNDIFDNDGAPIAIPTVWWQNNQQTQEALDYAASPAPHCNHQLANICVSGFTSSGTGVVIDATGNWWGSSDLGTIQDRFALHAQSVTEIDITDYLDGAGGNPVSLGTRAWVATIFEVSHTPPRFSPRDGQVVQVSFHLAIAGDITLRVFPEDPAHGTTPVYTANLGSFSAGGPHIVTWDGKNDGGFFVRDEAYAYELELDDGVGGILGSYKPEMNAIHYGHGCDPAINPLGISCNTLPGEFNAFRNEHWTHDYQLIPNTYNADTLAFSNSDETVYPYRSFPSRVTLRVRSPAGTGSWWTAIDRIPVLPAEAPAGAENLHHFVFDGRLSDESILDGTADFHFWPPEPMKANAVLVDGATPRVRGSETAGAGADWVPLSIEVKANPYLVRHSYEHVTHIAYQLNTRSRVKITINDPTGTTIDTLWDHDDGPGEDGMQEAEELGAPKVWVFPWTGVGTGNDSNNLWSDASGPYTFEIRAEDEFDASLYSTYKGVIQVRQ